MKEVLVIFEFFGKKFTISNFNNYHFFVIFTFSKLEHFEFILSCVQKNVNKTLY